MDAVIKCYCTKTHRKLLLVGLLLRLQLLCARTPAKIDEGEKKLRKTRRQRKTNMDGEREIEGEEKGRGRRMRRRRRRRKRNMRSEERKERESERGGWRG